MPVLTFRSPVTTRLHPHTAPVPPAGEFRVTQRFSDLDYYWSNVPNPPNPLPTHNATDIGNLRCNDPIVAMAPGIAYRIQDNATALGAATNALGVRIDHGFGVTSEYWHLNRQDVYNGQPVNAGFQIGLLGSTGLGAVCHTHIEVKRNGTRIDPEPLMFGGSLLIAEDDMKIKGKFLRHIQNRSTTLTADAHFRAGVLAGDDDSLAILKAGTILYPIVAVEGRQVGVEKEWLGALAYAGSSYQLGYVHVSVVSPLQPIEASGFSQADLDSAKSSATAAGRADMHAKAIVAAENHLSAVRALK